MNYTPPTPEEFGQMGRRLGVTPQAEYLRAMECGVPTVLPRDLFRSVNTRHRRNAVIATAKRAGVKIQTLSRDNDVWVMRIS